MVGEFARVVGNEHALPPGDHGPAPSRGGGDAGQPHRERFQHLVLYPSAHSQRRDEDFRGIEEGARSGTRPVTVTPRRFAKRSTAGAGLLPQIVKLAFGTSAWMPGNTSSQNHSTASIWR